MEVLLYAESESDASAVLCCHFSAYFVQFCDIVAAYIFIATILHLAEWSVSRQVSILLFDPVLYDMHWLL